MTAVIAGVDIGNATTEVAVLAGGRLLGTDRLPTRGRKGSADSVRGAAALVRRAERRLGVQVTEASIAPLRAVDTATLAVPALPPRTGRLRVLAAGVATPGGAGSCVGRPLVLDAAGEARPAGGPRIVLVPPGLGYAAAAAQVGRLIDAGVPAGAVLAAGDEGVLIANRLAAPVPVIDQVDTAAAAACPLLAVEVRAPGQPLTMLTDPVALGAALRLGDGEAADAVTLSRLLLDYSNAVIGLAGPDAGNGAGAGPATGPWLLAQGRRVPLREACAELAGWPPGTVSALGTAAGQTPVDDLYALDLAQVADTATARRGSTGRTVLAAWLHCAGPAWTTRRCSASCSAGRCTAWSASPPRPGWGLAPPRARVPTRPWWTWARAPSTSSRRTVRWSRPAPATCSPRPWPSC